MAEHSGLDAFLSEDRKYSLTAVAYQTVDAFAKITGKKIWLTHGDAANDGAQIHANLRDPTVYQQVEHQLAYILFDTDTLARDHFIDQFIRLSAKSAIRFNTVLVSESTRRLLLDLVSVLDAERVVSLWGRLYEGSESLIREYLFANVNEAFHTRQATVAAAFGAFQAGVAVAEKFAKHTAIFEEALNKVRYKGYDAVLLTARWFLMQIINDLAEDPESVVSRVDALQDLAKQAPRQTIQRTAFDAALPPKYPSGSAKKKAAALTASVIRADLQAEDNLPAMLADSETKMEQRLEEILQALRQNRVQDTDVLRRDVKAKVVFHDIRPEDILDEERCVLTPADSVLVSRLRAQFVRVMGRRAYRLEDSGTNIDVGAVIQARISGNPQPIFCANRRQRGFRALILLDRSESMAGNKIKAAERACRVIESALDLPFVEVEVWGFNMLEVGQVDLTRYHKDVTNFDSEKSRVKGNTPIHLALQVAANRLLQGNEHKHLFVITDGIPVYQLKNGNVVPEKTQVVWSRNTIRGMRRKGIGVTGIAVGCDPHQTMKDSVLTYMFGEARHWERVRIREFGSSLIDLVSKSFTSYLRRG